MNLSKIAIIVIMVFFISCVPVKDLKYFNDTNQTAPEVNPRVQKVIMPFDKLFIKVLSIDAPTSLIFNSSEEMRYGNGTSGVIGYLVDEKGEINFPFVGNIMVGSLTTAQAGEKIQKALNDYVSNTSIIVKYIDNQVTVMGEVQRQGVVQFTQDKLTIYEALSLGGGITRYGDRKNVMLIRNEGAKIMRYRLNLSDSRIAGKSYYYILPNDIIIVEPLKTISSSYSNNTLTTALSSITTLIAVLLFLGLKF